MDLSGRTLLIRNVVVGWASQLLVIITGFFMPRIIDQELGQVTVGIWDLAWSLVAYLSLTQLGIASSLNRYVATYLASNDLHALKVATSTVVCIQLGLSAVILVLVIAGYFAIPVWFLDELGDQVRLAQLTFLMLGMSIVVQFMFDTSRGILTGSHRWDLYNGLYSGIQVLCSILMIVSVILGKDLVFISIIYLCAIIGENLIRVAVVRRVCPEATFGFKYVSRDFGLEIFAFGTKSFTLNAAPMIVIQGVSVLIASTLGPGALAVFSRPNALIRFIQSFVTRFTFVLTPMAGPILLEEGGESLRRFAIDATKFGFAFTMPVVGTFFMVGGEVIRLWMGDDYVDRSLVWILGIGFLPTLTHSPLIRILIGIDRHGKAAVLSMAISLAMMVLGIGLVSRSSLSLDAFAMLVASTMILSSGLLIPIYACRVLDISFRVYCGQILAPVMKLAIPPLLVGFWMVENFDFGGLAFVVPASLYMLIVIVSYWFWLLSADQKQMLRQKLLPSKKD